MNGHYNDDFIRNTVLKSTIISQVYGCVQFCDAMRFSIVAKTQQVQLLLPASNALDFIVGDQWFAF